MEGPSKNTLKELLNPNQINTAPTTESWCRLTSLNSHHPNIYITADTHTFGRVDKNNTVISDKRLSSTHCTLSREKKENGEYTYYVHDTSSNGTYINNIKIGKGIKKEIQNNDYIQLLSSKMVPPQDVIAYVFSLSGTTQGKRKQSQENNYTDSKRQKIDSSISDEMKCCICIDIIYQAVTVMPCLHNFCGGCYSLWMNKSANCPQCRKKVVEVSKNDGLTNLIERFIDTHPESRKSKEEMEDQQKNNKINGYSIKVAKEDNIKSSKAKLSNGKDIDLKYDTDSDFDSDGSASDEDTPLKTSIKALTTRLLQCNACKKNIGVNEAPDKCIVCNYSQHMGCRQRGRRILAISAHNIQGIPVDCFKSNKEEQKILSTYIATQNINMSALFDKLTIDIESKKMTIKNRMIVSRLKRR
jgi:pSer/pThr/pTyr-binding forkhead associated (FHA) protein